MSFVKENCHCENCKCTAEHHCGCMSSGGCTCTDEECRCYRDKHSKDNSEDLWKKLKESIIGDPTVPLEKSPGVSKSLVPPTHIRDPPFPGEDL